MKRWLILILFLIAGCNQNVNNYKELIVNECIESCKNININLKDGPCLGLIAEDWVCDIAHNPRIEVDNKEENQCLDYNEGRAKHFVELNEKCNFIRLD